MYACMVGLCIYTLKIISFFLKQTKNPYYYYSFLPAKVMSF